MWADFGVSTVSYTSGVHGFMISFAYPTSYFTLCEVAAIEGGETAVVDRSL